MFAALPSVAQPDLGPGEQAAEEAALRVIRGQDIAWLERNPNDRTPAAELLVEWLKKQLEPSGR
jgi:hypothetical protein